MNGELDLIRSFHLEDQAIDAGSRAEARSALLAHIAESAPVKRVARPRRLGTRVPRVRVPADVLACGVGVLVVAAVCAVILSVGGARHTFPPAHQLRQHRGPPVIQNYSPRTAPRLPGQPHTADLAKPGAIAGLGGSPSGIFTTANSVVGGVNETTFLITASGLAPNTRGDVYAVWMLPAVATIAPGGYVLIKPIRPRLLGVIRPGIGADGKLDAEGTVTADVLNGAAYLVQITLQRSATFTTPGRVVLRGVA